MQSVSRFITGKLKLVVNEAKSSVTTPWDTRFLGFRIWQMMGKTQIGIHSKSLKRFKDNIRTHTARNKGRSLKQVIVAINNYTRGWWNYFRIGGTKTLIQELNKWILRRLRAYVWNQWRLPRTKVRELLARGVYLKWAKLAGNARLGPWHMGKNSWVMRALPEEYFTAKFGLALLG